MNHARIHALQEIPMTVTIRPAEKRDVLAVAELIEEMERFYGSTEVQPLEGAPIPSGGSAVRLPAVGVRSLGRGRGRRHRRARRLLVPVAGRGSSHSLFLKELYIRSTLRRQGVGARMMQELRNIAAARPGCTRVEWMADHDNPDACDFYRSLGFAELDGKIVYRLDAGEA